MNTPSEELAQKIIDRLVAEHLVTAEDAAKLVPKLAASRRDRFLETCHVYTENRAMSHGALKKLTVEHFRGAVHPFVLTFEKGKTLTVIYGENGAGKSTICDALDFLGKGQVGSLASRGLGKTNPYWHSVGKRPADVAVTLETSGGACRATMNRVGVTVTPPDQRPRVEVLRRAQILSLIESRASDRYAAISRFIDVSGVEESEAALLSEIKSVEGSLEIAITRVQENRDTIRLVPSAAVRSGSAAWWNG